LRPNQLIAIAIDGGKFIMLSTFKRDEAVLLMLLLLSITNSNLEGKATVITQQTLFKDRELIDD
jgi:hypothetical protein